MPRTLRRGAAGHLESLKEAVESAVGSIPVQSRHGLDDIVHRFCSVSNQIFRGRDQGITVQVGSDVGDDRRDGVCRSEEDVLVRKGLELCAEHIEGESRIGETGPVSGIVQTSVGYDGLDALPQGIEVVRLVEIVGVCGSQSQQNVWDAVLDLLQLVVDSGRDSLILLARSLRATITKVNRYRAALIGTKRTIDSGS